MRILATLAAIAAIALTHPVYAQNYRATNWLAPIHTLNSEPYQKFAKDLATSTDGAIDFTVYSSGSLVPAKTTLQALRDGVAVLGIVYPPYTPADLPLNNVLNDLAFAATDPMATAFAYTEINLTNPRLIAEWKDQGVIFAGGYSTPLYNFVCVKPIQTLREAKGKKIRTAGGTQTDWVTSIDAVPVSVPIGDVYTGLSRGSLDCTMSNTPDLANSKLWEVAKSVTRLPMGVVVGATYVLNPRFWQQLSTNLRRKLLDQMATGMADAQVAYAQRVKEAIKGSKKRGLQILQPSDDLTKNLDTFKQDFVENLADEEMKKFSIPDPSNLIQQFQELQTKWHKLLKNVDRHDSDALAELLKTEIYDKIDVSSFAID